MNGREAFLMNASMKSSGIEKMIVPFEINTGILQNKKENASLLRSLAETIMDFGAIPWSHDLQEAIRNAQIDKLTCAFLKAGSKTISVPMYEVSSEVVNSNGVQGLIVLPSNDFDLQKELIKDPSAEDRIVLPPSNAELVPLRNTTESEILKNRKTWSNDTLDPRNMDRALIWSDRIRPVLENSTKWSLVDANFLEHFLDPKHNGPRWLIKQISEMFGPQNRFDKKIRFNIFSSLPNFEISKSRAEKAFSDIVSLFPSDKISISLYSSEERLFRSFTHSRYIRCNNDGLNRRLSFSDSFDVFDAPGTRPPFDFFYNRDSTDISQMYQDRELELQRRSKKSGMNFSSES
jgi:hypothetical protein